MRRLAQVFSFPSEDPIGYDGGINLYLYVEADPVDLVDHLGLLGSAYDSSYKTAASMCSQAAGAPSTFGAIVATCEPPTRLMPTSTFLAWLTARRRPVASWGW